MGFLCAILSLLAILGGKVFAVQHIVIHYAQAELEKEYCQENYDAFVILSQEFKKVKSEKEYPFFMVRFGMTDAKAPQAVPAKEVEDFKTEFVPLVKRQIETSMSFEEWRRRNIDEDMTRFTREFKAIDVVLEHLEPIDALFALLGIVTAFKLGSGAAEREA